MKRVTVQWFAALADQRGLGSETVSTQAGTASQLYEELRAEHGLLLPPASVKAVVGGEIVHADTPIVDGSTIAYLPPVAGG